MKKKILPMLGIVALVAVVIGVLAIGGLAAEKPMQVGYAIVNVMPKESGLPLGGYGNTLERLSDNSLTKDPWDMLKASCVAITDGQGNTVLLIGMDEVRAQEIVVATARRKINWATGIPEDHIMINATHTHSAPDLGSNVTKIHNYVDQLSDCLRDAAVEAVADREEIDKMQGGSIQTEGLNWVRHYTYKDSKGDLQYFGDSFGTVTINSTTEHVIEPDRTLHVLQFTRKNGKQPVVLVNFRMHPHSQGSATDLKPTADVIGTFRYAMENQGYLVSYYQGAAGMINSGSRLSTDKRYTKEQYVQYGEKMAEYVMKCPLKDLTPGVIKTVQYQYIGTTNRNQDELYEAAKVCAGIWSDPTQGDLTTRRKLIQEKGFRSPYQCNAITTRHNLPDHLTMELDAITIGKAVEISTTPFEMFHETSMWLEQQMRGTYQLSMSFGYTNGHMSYVPTHTVWKYTSYETDISYWQEGTAEDVVYTICDMLGVSHKEDCP